MSEQEILEGNKLIAEFDGAIFTNDDTEAYPQGYLYFQDIGAREAKNLMYNDSWDWIMPVVEKIHSYTDFWVTIYYRSCKVFPMNRGVEMEILIEEKPTIEAVWIAVVEFIKWHNKQQGK